MIYLPYKYLPAYIFISMNSFIKKTIDYTKKIEVIDGLLTESDIKYLHSPKRQMSYGWLSNGKKKYDHGHWNYFVSGANTPEEEKLNMDCQFNPEFLNSSISIIWNRLKRIIGERKVIRCYFNGYTYGTEGYVHRDTVDEVPGWKQETVLIYCSNEWKADWAGETQFLCEDQKEIVYSTMPLPNRIVCFDSSIPHVARSVSRSYPGLRTILAFKTSVFNIDEQQCIDYIKERTEGIPHSRSTFFEHLYGTYEILKGLGLSQDVCMAGLFHAIYGTTYFKHDLTVDRDEVKRLIGDYAEHLAYEFCSMPNRTPNIITNSKKGNAKSFHLACIEYANLLEQAPRFEGKKIRETIDELYSIIRGD
jgi:SM-20-related protein